MTDKKSKNNGKSNRRSFGSATTTPTTKTCRRGPGYATLRMTAFWGVRSGQRREHSRFPEGMTNKKGKNNGKSNRRSFDSATTTPTTKTCRWGPGYASLRMTAFLGVRSG